MTKTILVVEDEKGLQKAIETSLTKNGFDVVAVSSAHAAKTVLDSNQKVDAVWLDHYLLGNETGLDVLYDLRESKSRRDVPVFAVTNSVGDDKVASYELLGIEKYFIKSNTSLADIVGSVKEAVK
jgi:CheY-like chemotaxis protein